MRWGRVSILFTGVVSANVCNWAGLKQDGGTWFESITGMADIQTLEAASQPSGSALAGSCNQEPEPNIELRHADVRCKC